MAVPQNKVTRSRRNKRRSHDAIFPDSSMECQNCGELKRPHHVCGSCGYYDGRAVVSMDLEEDDAE
ncbi:MAG: 50S ribosomal protein L32 [Albidovulum sp.]|nr:50S ribosomal protein L32 [Albidovulum sp.]MDE0531297.1 50S ribosomal protein L32 [Albidovulum sp.]